MASGYSDLSEIRKANQFYGTHQKPPKINLLNEKPRRESLVEQQLSARIESPINFQQQQVDNVRFNELASSSSNHSNSTYAAQGSQQQQQLHQNVNNFNYNNPNNNNNLSARTTSTTTTTARNFGPSQGNVQKAGSNRVITTQTVTTQRNAQATNDQLIAYSELVNDLTKKEARLRKELAYMNQHLANPWARPPQTREPRREPSPRVTREQQRWVKELPIGGSSPLSRPTSRASSTRSTTEADLMEKADQLLKDVEELEKKPMKTQQILIESGAVRRNQVPNLSSPAGSGRDAMGSGDGSSMHTAIINVPNVEPNNKSPLPFAFDNFSTLGVRGNIASVGAAEPEKPYPPIFPIVKRTPSPRREY